MENVGSTRDSPAVASKSLMQLESCLARSSVRTASHSYHSLQWEWELVPRTTAREDFASNGESWSPGVTHVVLEIYLAAAVVPAQGEDEGICIHQYSNHTCCMESSTFEFWCPPSSADFPQFTWRSALPGLFILCCYIVDLDNLIQACLEGRLIRDWWLYGVASMSQSK